MRTEVQIAGTNATPFRVARDGREVTLTIAPERDSVTGACFIMALSLTNETRAADWMPARNPLRQLAWDAGSIFRILKGLVTPKEAKATARALGGPVMIAEGIYRSMRRDVWDGIGFLRFLNVNLAVLNLLPIPVLDGGLILFSLIALVFRRRLPEKLTGALSMVFMYLLMGLMGVLILKDTVRSWKINTYRPPAEAVNRAATNQLDKAAAPAGKR
jgi:regulator of sigma E protease